MFNHIAKIHECMAITNQLIAEGYTWRHQTTSYIFFTKNGLSWRVCRNTRTLEVRSQNAWKPVCPIMLEIT